MPHRTVWQTFRLMVYPHPHPSARPQATWEEYLALEARSEERYEYHDGEIVAMAGASNQHNEIITNTTLALKPGALAQGCKYFAETTKLFRHQSPRYLYPDAMVTCPPLDLQAKNGVRSPLLVVEVLSDSSRRKDRSFKLREYLGLPSLHHYLLVEQEYVEVQHFQRAGADSWHIHFYDDLAQGIDLPELALTLPLAALYAGITFGPEGELLREEMAPYDSDSED